MIATNEIEAPARKGQVVYLAHEVLHPSALNPRKEFKQEPLDELSANIERIGVKQPLLVRPSKQHSGHYEIIAGERRWKGNGLALDRVSHYDSAEEASSGVLRLAELPCMVEDMSDAEAQEFMLIENLQREGLSAVEEASGYRDLLALKGEDGMVLYTVEKIAGRINRTANHVRKRLKVLLAPVSLLRACDDNIIGTRVCELVGRVPDPAAREEIAKKILHPDYRDSDVPMTVKETIALIRKDYMIALKKGCGFDPESADLLPVELDRAGLRACGGACTDCPFRSGMDESLQDELAVTVTEQGATARGRKSGVDPNLCTKPSCFHRKVELSWQSVAASAEGRGEKVLSMQQAKKEFDEDSLDDDSDFIDLADQPTYQEVGHYNTADLPEWGELLRESPVQVTVTVAKNPTTGRIHRLVPRSEAIEAAKQAAKAEGRKDVFERAPAGAASSSGSKEDKKAEDKRVREENRLANAELHEGLNALGEAAAKRGYDADQGFELLKIMLNSMNACAVAVVGKALKVEPAKKGEPGYVGSERNYLLPILTHIQATAMTRPKVDGLMVMFIAAEGLLSASGTSPIWGRDNWKLLASTFGVVEDAVRRLALVEVGGLSKKEEISVTANSIADRRIAAMTELESLYVEAGHSAIELEREEDEFVSWLDAIAKEHGLKLYTAKNHGVDDLEKLVPVVREVVAKLDLPIQIDPDLQAKPREKAASTQHEELERLFNRSLNQPEDAPVDYVKLVEWLDQYAYRHNVGHRDGAPFLKLYSEPDFSEKDLERLVEALRKDVGEATEPPIGGTPTVLAGWALVPNKSSSKYHFFRGGDGSLCGKHKALCGNVEDRAPAPHVDCHACIESLTGLNLGVKKSAKKAAKKAAAKKVGKKK